MSRGANEVGKSMLQRTDAIQSAQGMGRQWGGITKPQVCSKLQINEQVRILSGAAMMSPRITMLKTAIFRGKLEMRTVLATSNSEHFRPEARDTRKSVTESAIKTKKNTPLHKPRHPSQGLGTGIYTMGAIEQTRKHAQHTKRWKRSRGCAANRPTELGDSIIHEGDWQHSLGLRLKGRRHGLVFDGGENTSGHDKWHHRWRAS
jgi:hypothetical protein